MRAILIDQLNVFIVRPNFQFINFLIENLMHRLSSPAFTRIIVILTLLRLMVQSILL